MPLPGTMLPSVEDKENKPDRGNCHANARRLPALNDLLHKLCRRVFMLSLKNSTLALTVVINYLKHNRYNSQPRYYL